MFTMLFVVEEVFRYKEESYEVYIFDKSLLEF
jgi:hypothetical protein